MTFKLATASWLVVVLGLGSTALLPLPAAAQIITTVAGGGVNDGGQATNAALVLPRYLAYDAAGNLYISTLDNRIRRVDTAGVITTVIGNGVSGYSGDGGPASLATLTAPAGIRFDAAGNLFIADQTNHAIRKVDTAGIITTIAGTGTPGYSGDGGPATQAELNEPFGLALASDGSIYFAGVSNNVVRKIDPSRTISTVAGNGTQTGSIDGEGNDPTDDLGDDGPATLATLNLPRSVLLDEANGILYIADTPNHRVRKVTLLTGIITTVAGNGLPGFDGDGGPATTARIGNPRGLAFDAGGNLLITNSPNRVRRVDSSGIITTIAGIWGGFSGDGHPALATTFSFLTDLIFDSAGNMLLADGGNARVRKINVTTEIVTTVAGGFLGDGGPATAAALNLSQGVAVDPLGNLYIADTYNHRVRKVDTFGAITTLAGTGISTCSIDCEGGDPADDLGDGGPATAATLSWPYGVAADASGNVFIADAYNLVVRKVDTSGTISTFFQDNDFDAVAVALDSLGNLYVADDWSCVVRKVDSFGSATVVAGTLGNCGFSGDGSLATAAELNPPYGVALDSAGNLYIADSNNNRVRKVDTAGYISTVAGTGACDFSGDGGPATAAALCNPTGVAVDAAGTLYIGDYDNARVRRVNASGTISTLVGDAGFGYAGDGGPAGDARLGGLWGVAVDTLGNVYVADDFFSRVRKVTFDPAQAIQVLVSLVQGLNLQQGISNSLDAKLGNAVKALEAVNAGQRQDAVNKMEAFINAVEAQRGKGLTDAQADQLVAAARAVLALL